MDIERPHRTSSTPTTTTSELFICFTSRLSHSSSMRLSSKSILSPARSGDKPTGSHSLTTSLSRRSQSPAMFSSKRNKSGPGFENPEPSSPKVTCIGQVRVKTKKQGKKMKMRACRSKSKRLSGGEASFRRIEHGGLTPQNSVGIQNQRNQKWVHLPLTICEALRAFGSEFSCLLPCKSSCFSKGEKRDGCENNASGSCGAVCRWLVALQEGEDKGRDIELVVGDEERERECCRRRSIFDDMEFKDEIFEVKNGGEEEESGGRVSICIPPKNALLLMRCRSDPMKMSALSQKIWEAPVVDLSDDEEKEKEKEEDEEEKEGSEMGEKLGEECVEIDEIAEDLAIFSEEGEKTEEKQSTENREGEREGKYEEGTQLVQEEVKEEEEEEEEEEDENQPKEYPQEAVSLEEREENVENEQDLVNDNTKEDEAEKVENSEISSSSSSSSSSDSSVEESTSESRENQEENDQEKEIFKSMEEEEEEEEPQLEDESHENVTHQKTEQIPEEKPKENVENESKWEKNQQIDKPVLPDCLLLMMCEPKLSMEVSKETWVCSTDFIRWLPERHPNKKPTKTDGSDEPKKKKTAPPPPPPPVQAPVLPGRSSISFPTGGGPVANLVEQKLVKSGGIEPFVLTRCKSAPMRSTAKNAPPELPCSLWRRESSRKIEPHRPSFGATGVGF